MFMRIGLLMTLSWLAGMTTPLVSVLDWSFSGRDLVLIIGGLFLLWKSVGEIHQTFEGAENAAREPKRLGFAMAIAQIIAIDLVFSLDSIITAVGMVDQLPVMIAAVIVSVGLMMCFARPIGHFVSDHPTIKMLALSFLVVVAVVLMADGFGHHVPKGYIYSAMAFSVVVEMLNIRLRRRTGAGLPAAQAKSES
jgi:predicted tellurium resistance membrane protein TerC